jgi:tetratricopeptide (TPR) repeat protein
MSMDSHQKPEVKQGASAVGENPKEPVSALPANQQAPGKPTLFQAATTQQAQPTVTPTNSSNEPNQPSGSLHIEIRPHAFVIMPFGKKKGADGQILDFNAIYQELLKPALVIAGFEPFRADEETKSGDILTDMFQELLLADLCLADMSIDNANVFYELGIRHAFRKRGVVHIQSGRAYMPFDVFNVRTIPYHITIDGVPDTDFIEKDKQAIARVARDTWASEAETVHSPVFNLLTGLVEPDRKALRTPLATGFWREYNEWKQRVTLAQRQGLIGDILLLTEEIRNPLIKEEAIGEAGKALANMGRNELALEQYRKGLGLNAHNLNFRREEVYHLNRLGRVDEAIIKIENLIADVPTDTESIAYLGRIYKEMWTDSWKSIKDKKERLKTAFDSYHWLLKSIASYLKGYRLDLDQFYPGINALTLATILIHLADKYENKKDPDPDITYVRELMPELRGSLVFALETKSEDERADYWTLISLAELRILTADNTQNIVRAFRKALTASRRNQAYLQTSLNQLEILQSLDLRVEYAQEGMKVIRDELQRINQESGIFSSLAQVKAKAASKRPGKVFLFAGYMVNHQGKEQDTFPKEKETQIRAEIARRLDKFEACADDRAYTAGLSAGSEIIFAELCTERGLRVGVHLPLPEAAYVREFVSPGGDAWVDRFYKIRGHSLVEEMDQVEHIGNPPEGVDLFERNNRWALYSSLRRGIGNVRLITLWDEGDGQKDRDVHLVKHMVDLMHEIGGQVEQINSAKFVRGITEGVYDELSDPAQPAQGRQQSRSLISNSKAPSKKKPIKKK